MEFALPEPVLEALNRLKQAGFAAYVVGGCVRDHVLGMVPHDYDICTAARPEDMKKVFLTESMKLNFSRTSLFLSILVQCFHWETPDWQIN